MAIPGYLITILLLSSFSSSLAQLNPQNITLGSSLTPIGTRNSTWLSPSGLYAFGFYKQQNAGIGYYVGIFLAGIPEKTVVWTANRDDPPLSSDVTLLFDTNGQLILHQPDNQNTSLMDTSSSAYASMLDSGNFILYNSNGEPIWQSFDNPTDTILPTQSLSNGKSLFSAETKINPATGYFKLSMQTDGNLVQHPVQWPETVSSSYFAAFINGLGAIGPGAIGPGAIITLNLDKNGNLYLFNSTIVLNLTQHFAADDDGKLYLMRIDPDGIFRVYSHGSNWSVVWASTTDLCAPKGLCGNNGFCVLQDNVADCRCLPGFDFVSPGNWSSGCKLDFSVNSCKSNDSQVVSPTINILPNTVWEDDSYSVVSPITQQACQQACLDDCNCQVALYKEGNCRKQRLPLRYGRRQMEDSNMALVKTQTRTGDENNDIVPPKKQEKRHPGVVMLSVASSLVGLACILLIASGFLFYRSRLNGYRTPPRMGIADLGEDIAPREFSYLELEQITDGFKEELGKGASGVVYKGTLPHNGTSIAVKKLEKVSKEGEMEFLNEMKVIGKTHHRNLLRLIGYCHDGTNKLLAVEFMSNGSLADNLFTPEKRPSWDERIRIALDVVKGILYLHEECETQIIHCDIKPQNILMDEYRVIKISDFGMAKLLQHDQTKTYTAIRGTRGYLAPEWHRNLPITVKADVYSFGIVLLEIITCRRCLNWSLPEEEAVLEEWVYSCFEAGELQKLVGEEEVDMKMLKRMVKVGIWCIQEEPSLRPTMKKVLLMLEGTVDIPVPPSPTSFFATFRDSSRTY
ncbi:G-type lectin S-receptor-like serine/threonine-protein kinase LECRK3 isoform X2 [Impatiens glandulifera]|uniref:G-type lectin S-receptor-like serine/threonine-protein kinase LECRK3 isoform X1 n=1 Tax=Impatiens glandulifera TaxID=253017 RepID=UPI001FB0F1FF|nr:G-type lectin S-receptor-like serine/threonine-protein kinase LECRK3 isoform X1 [Impatiens glandulifera]XP_047333609.1 G-type lectin S-receptor-like serine/threonine-protein kinase LECRK3 isoform X2 [Impatiens glandulifera]